MSSSNNEYILNHKLFNKIVFFFVFLLQLVLNLYLGKYCKLFKLFKYLDCQRICDFNVT